MVFPADTVAFMGAGIGALLTYVLTLTARWAKVGFQFGSSSAAIVTLKAADAEALKNIAELYGLLRSLERDVANHRLEVARQFAGVVTDPALKASEDRILELLTKTEDRLTDAIARLERSVVTTEGRFAEAVDHMRGDFQKLMSVLANQK